MKTGGGSAGEVSAGAVSGRSKVVTGSTGRPPCRRRSSAISCSRTLILRFMAIRAPIAQPRAAPVRAPGKPYREPPRNRPNINSATVIDFLIIRGDVYPLLVRNHARHDEK